MGDRQRLSQLQNGDKTDSPITVAFKHTCGWKEIRGRNQKELEGWK